MRAKFRNVSRFRVVSELLPVDPVSLLYFSAGPNSYNTLEVTVNETLPGTWTFPMTGSAITRAEFMSLSICNNINVKSSQNYGDVTGGDLFSALYDGEYLTIIHTSESLGIVPSFLDASTVDMLPASWIVLDQASSSAVALESSECDHIVYDVNITSIDEWITSVDGLVVGPHFIEFPSIAIDRSVPSLASSKLVGDIAVSLGLVESTFFGRPFTLLSVSGNNLKIVVAMKRADLGTAYERFYLTENGNWATQGSLGINFSTYDLSLWQPSAMNQVPSEDRFLEGLVTGAIAKTLLTPMSKEMT